MRHGVDVHFPLGYREPLDAIEEVFQCVKNGGLVLQHGSGYVGRVVAACRRTLSLCV